MTKEPGRDLAPAVTRSIRLLDILAESRVPLTLTQLASQLGLAKSSTTNLCAALEASRMIERVPSGYRLGVHTAQLGGAFVTQFHQVREFYNVCERSDVLSRELVQVAILDGRNALYLARYEGARPIRIGTPLGSRLPAALSAAGRALLMGESPEFLRTLLEDDAPFFTVTRREEIDIDALIERLDAFNRRGWAVDDEESYPGIVGVAVSLDGWAPGDPKLGLGVAIPAGDATDRWRRRVADSLLEAASLLTNPLAAPKRGVFTVDDE